MMSSVLNIFAKSSPAPRSVNGDKQPRGTKRKAKSDPYDEIDDDEPAQKTPSTQHTRTRISSETPNSSRKGRPSSTSKTNKSQSRLRGTRKSEITDTARVDAVANLARAQEPEAARLHLQPKEESSQNSQVPVANMGVPEPSINANATPSESANKKPQPGRPNQTRKNAKGKEKATEPSRTKQTQPETDEREEKEIQGLLQHRMAQDGRVELLVHWAGESEDDATWEVEEEIQRGAEETLYAYWKAQGGRINALFIKPKNAPVETYHVYKLLGHERKIRGGFEFEVQWVGHPPTRGETSFEAEAKLKKIAPEVLEQYWRDVGGRDRFLARRGRGKKQRTD
ncbi:uncharacterized protein F4812DRAFT_425720 [Daldinia caldariorum]|uniref:uncharacterized protein n=1 Tax=Daldinia caldariorum TaxID=326644 RepID=UPI00200797F7|nr:uncharacterized protein F4812DRAFT_425720 [Daldinia caldariorum]KAI1469052.1 hypothetical protein F4812DRAFT_425720 [Daldinia caldariorum]